MIPNIGMYTGYMCFILLYLAANPTAKALVCKLTGATQFRGIQVVEKV
jgi:hypothetical protein